MAEQNIRKGVGNLRTLFSTEPSRRICLIPIAPIEGSAYIASQQYRNEPGWTTVSLLSSSRYRADGL